MSVRLFAILLLLGATPSVLAADTRTDTKVTLETGFDSNAFRTFTEAVPSAFTLVMATGDWGVRSDPAALAANFMAGAKGFFPAYGESSLAQALDVVAVVAVPRSMRLGIEGREKTLNTVINDRDYAEAGGVGFVESTLAEDLTLRLNLGLRQYWFFPDRGYDSFGPEMGAVLRFMPRRRHTLFASAALSPRRYPSSIRSSTDPNQFIEGIPRQDTEVYATAGYVYRGRIAFQASYELFADFSNSFGEKVDRHRLNLALGAKIPGIDVFADLAGTLQLVVYPDGVYFSSRDVALEDNERYSSISILLAKPLTERWDLEGRYAFYVSTFYLYGLIYMRHVATVGVSVRF